MTPSRRSRLVRFLADMDQRTALANSLSKSPVLTKGERHFAKVQLDFQRQVVARIEKMLA